MLTDKPIFRSQISPKDLTDRINLNLELVQLQIERELRLRYNGCLTELELRSLIPIAYTYGLRDLAEEMQNTLDQLIRQ